jgi:hypothetical protein
VAVDVDEMVISFAQATVEGILKLLERVTSVHYRKFSTNLQERQGSTYLVEVTVSAIKLH